MPSLPNAGMPPVVPKWMNTLSASVPYVRILSGSRGVPVAPWRSAP